MSQQSQPVFSYRSLNNDLAQESQNNSTQNLYQPNLVLNDKPEKETRKRSLVSLNSSKPESSLDRFIPNRKATNTEFSNYLLSQKDQTVLSSSQSSTTSSDNSNLNFLIADSNSRILQFKQKHEAQFRFPDISQSCSQGSYSQQFLQKHKRVIPSMPLKVLDAPNILDDFYLQLLDWGSNGILAVCLGSAIYLWNQYTGGNQLLIDTQDARNYIGSVSWMKDRDCLAIGFANSKIQLFDTQKCVPYRTLSGHTDRVTCLNWNNHILTSGSSDTKIINHDIRCQNNIVSTYDNNFYQICSLKWNSDGDVLASGGNDNQIKLWDFKQQALRFRMTEHEAAVKALAWCPLQKNLLGSGGGCDDRSIKFWNTDSGNLISSTRVESQVCQIVWSKFDKELISSHGYSNNQLIVWKYPQMTRQAELKGHKDRVLNLVLNPQGTNVCSGASDQTLRIWKIFDQNGETKLTKQHSKDALINQSFTSLR